MAKWKKVSEELPSYDTNVLVYTNRGSYKITKLFRCKMFDGTEYDRWDGGQANIIAWHEIPKYNEKERKRNDGRLDHSD